MKRPENEIVFGGYSGTQLEPIAESVVDDAVMAGQQEQFREICRLIIAKLDALRHAGCECAYCDGIIKSEADGTSSPQGSMHKECAVQHEDENPDEW